MNTVWIFDITEVLLIFLGMVTRLTFLCNAGAGDLHFTFASKGAVEGDWKLSEQQGITSSCLLTVLVLVYCSCGHRCSESSLTQQ